MLKDNDESQHSENNEETTVIYNNNVTITGFSSTKMLFRYGIVNLYFC